MATIVLAGGGTAGHIEPALAVARAWKHEHPDDSIIFIGTSAGLENTLVPAAGFDLAHIPKVAISRRPSGSWLRVPADLIHAIIAAGTILKGADLLIGFGGYVSAPVYIAARLRRIPFVIHEANIKPGWANRLGAWLTPYLAVANPVETKEFSQALITGLPLRSDVAAAYIQGQSDFKSARSQAKLRLGFDPNAPLFFIMGGSQGSVAINTAVVGAVPFFAAKGISVLHSVGAANILPKASATYHPVAYVHQMADAYLASDVVIARSGAVTCSEFRALGRYALFVPLPVGNGEQYFNAQSIVDEGRGQIVDQSDFNFDYLISHIDSLLAKSADSPIVGSDRDLLAGEKIVSLGEFAMLNK